MEINAKENASVHRQSDLSFSILISPSPPRPSSSSSSSVPPPPASFVGTGGGGGALASGRPTSLTSSLFSKAGALLSSSSSSKAAEVVERRGVGKGEAGARDGGITPRQNQKNDDHRGLVLRPPHLPPPPPSAISSARKGTVDGVTINSLCNIMGAGTLALPFAFHNASLLTSVLLLLGVGLFSYHAAHCLVVGCDAVKRYSYTECIVMNLLPLSAEETRMFKKISCEKKKRERAKNALKNCGEGKKDEVGGGVSESDDDDTYSDDDDDTPSDVANNTRAVSGGAGYLSDAAAPSSVVTKRGSASVAPFPPSSSSSSRPSPLPLQSFDPLLNSKSRRILTILIESVIVLSGFGTLVVYSRVIGDAVPSVFAAAGYGKLFNLEDTTESQRAITAAMMTTTLAPDHKHHEIGKGTMGGLDSLFFIATLFPTSRSLANIADLILSWVIPSIVFFSLSCAEHMEKLKWASIIGFGTIFYIVVLVIGYYLKASVFSFAVEVGRGIRWVGLDWGIFGAISTFAIAFRYHFNVPYFYGEMQQRLPERFVWTMNVSMLIVILCYVFTGLCGYLLFGALVEGSHEDHQAGKGHGAGGHGHAGGNIIDNFEGDDVLANIGRFGLLIHFAMSYPIISVCTRRGMHRLYVLLSMPQRPPPRSLALLASASASSASATASIPVGGTTTTVSSSSSPSALTTPPSKVKVMGVLLPTSTSSAVASTAAIGVPLEKAVAAKTDVNQTGSAHRLPPPPLTAAVTVSNSNHFTNSSNTTNSSGSTSTSSSSSLSALPSSSSSSSSSSSDVLSADAPPSQKAIYIEAALLVVITSAIAHSIHGIGLVMELFGALFGVPTVLLLPGLVGLRVFDVKFADEWWLGHLRLCSRNKSGNKRRILGKRGTTSGENGSNGSVSGGDGGDDSDDKNISDDRAPILIKGNTTATTKANPTSDVASGSGNMSPPPAVVVAVASENTATIAVSSVNSTVRSQIDALLSSPLPPLLFGSLSQKEKILCLRFLSWAMVGFGVVSFAVGLLTSHHARA